MLSCLNTSSESRGTSRENEHETQECAKEERGNARSVTFTQRDREKIEYSSLLEEIEEFVGDFHYIVTDPGSTVVSQTDKVSIRAVKSENLSP